MVLETESMQSAPMTVICKYSDNYGNVPALHLPLCFLSNTTAVVCSMPCSLLILVLALLSGLRDIAATLDFKEIQECRIDKDMDVRS